MYAWEHAFSDKEVTEWINENMMRYDRDGYSYWAAIEKTANRLIGVSGLIVEYVEDKKYIGVGYIYNKAYWRKGYAIESASACVRYAFNQLQTDEITAQIRPENMPSRKVADKLGMKLKGQFIRHYKGKELPHLLYILTKGEYT